MQAAQRFRQAAVEVYAKGKVDLAQRPALAERARNGTMQFGTLTQVEPLKSEQPAEIPRNATCNPGAASETQNHKVCEKTNAIGQVP